jgi:hypothetical protein
MLDLLGHDEKSWTREIDADSHSRTIYDFPNRELFRVPDSEELSEFTSQTHIDIVGHIKYYPQTGHRNLTSLY